MNFISKLYSSLPNNLNVNIAFKEKFNDRFQVVSCEADEIWSFVGSRKDKRNWIYTWLVIERETLQVIAMHCGGRTKKDAKQLWNSLPEAIKKHSRFFTDFFAQYKSIFSNKKHIASGKDAGLTNHIERFNCTLRQRIGRLVRETLSFSRKIENHIGAIKYFICCYNLDKSPLLI